MHLLTWREFTEEQDEGDVGHRASQLAPAVEVQYMPSTYARTHDTTRTETNGAAKQLGRDARQPTSRAKVLLVGMGDILPAGSGMLVGCLVGVSSLTCFRMTRSMLGLI